MRPLPKSPSRPATNPPRERPPEVVAGLGKTASAYVEVSVPGHEITGTAFCIDRSGLFVTNAHVVEKPFEAKGRLRLVIDAGLETQRIIAAKLRRVDDYLDLALLEVEADPGVEPLELGKNQTLIETASVQAFGFPFGRTPTGGNPGYPNCSVVSGKITGLHGPRERLDGVQFDGQLNPGMSGGPVLDASGRVIGVSRATIPGQATNLAIPVGRLSEFLASLGISFNPQAVSYRDRDNEVKWLIKLEPPMRGAKVPDDLSVQVTVAQSEEDRRIYQAERSADGSFQVEVTPVRKSRPCPPG